MKFEIDKMHIFGATPIYIVIMIPMIFCLYGCDSNRDTKNDMIPSAELDKGWQEYLNGNYKMAMLSFEEVINSDAQPSVKGDAYNGLGWAYLHISGNFEVNKMNQRLALAKFKKAIEYDSGNDDAWIGYINSLYIMQAFGEEMVRAMNAMEIALKSNRKYLYRHDYYSKADIYALMAQCHFYVGEYETAIDKINKSLEIEKTNSTALALRIFLEG